MDAIQLPSLSWWRASGTISAPEYHDEPVRIRTVGERLPRERKRLSSSTARHYEDAVFGIGKNLPNPDALQEFNLITNTFSAEYGRTAGSIFNAVPKSGTNDIHGSAWDFLRNTDFNAKNWFLNAPGDKAATLQTESVRLYAGWACHQRISGFGLAPTRDCGSTTQSLLTCGLLHTGQASPRLLPRSGKATSRLPLNDPTTGACPSRPNGSRTCISLIPSTV
jgi:hypothetical protein